MDLDAACSPASVNTQDKSTSMMAGGETQQTARSESPTNEKIFDKNVVGFKEAVKWSGFIDRTLLIVELLEKSPHRVIIFAPKRVGKTMNLDMVECFLDRDIITEPKSVKELEKFANYETFRSCKIWKHTDFVKKYFGRHPVVRLNFKNVIVDSLDEAKNSVRLAIHRAYLKHSYLKNADVFNEDIKEYCQKWCDKKDYPDANAIEGIRALIEYLHTYHKRKVYLLVDEFDAPAVNALLAGKIGREVYSISKLVTQLLGAVVKDEFAEDHLLGSLITGVSYLGRIHISDDLNNMDVHKWMPKKSGRFDDYYGFSDDELTHSPLYSN